MNKYNGWSSWNEWNAVMWLSNDYGIEQQMRQWTDMLYSRNKIINLLSNIVLNDKTPDGAIFNKKAIKSYVDNYLD